MLQISGSQSVAPGSTAAASPGNLLEKQIPGPHPKPPEQDVLGTGLAGWVSKSLLGCSEDWRPLFAQLKEKKSYTYPLGQQPNPGHVIKFGIPASKNTISQDELLQQRNNLINHISSFYYFFFQKRLVFNFCEYFIIVPPPIWS